MTAPATRAHLLRQIARLEHAASTGEDWQRHMPRRLAKTMRVYLRDLRTAPLGWPQIAGMVGPNGGSCSTHAVTDACRHAEGAACVDDVVLSGVERAAMRRLAAGGYR